MDTLLMEISANIKAMLVKQDDMCADIVYLGGLKNKHEQRLSNLEKLVPDELDSRLRDLEINTKQYIFIVSIIVSLIVAILSKLVLDIVP